MTAVVLPGQLGQFLFQEFLHPDILDADGIEHAAGRFHDAGHGVAQARFERKPLDRDASQFLEVTVRHEFLAVAKGSRGRDHRVFQLHSGERYAHVHDQASRSRSCAQKTGPRVQTCTLAPLESVVTQPRQAPMPQAMVFSMESWARGPVLGRQVAHGLQEGQGAAGCDVSVLVASDAFVEHGDEGVQVLAGLLVECIQPPDQSVEKVQGKVFRGLGVTQKQFQVVGVAEFAGIAHEGSQADASGQGQGGLGTVAGEEAAQRSPSGYGITGTQMDELFGSRAELLDEEKNFLFVCPGNGKGPGQNGIQGDLAGPDHGELAGAEGGASPPPVFPAETGRLRPSLLARSG